MSDSAHTFDVTLENFESDVLAASQQVPIMLDFWASWCGPCQALIPVVTKLAEEYAGAFRLAKVNIDEQQQLATQFAVRSVPTVMLIKNGKVVEQFMGAQPESEIRKLLDKHIEKESDKLLDAALAQYEAGDTLKAIEAIQEISKMDPNNPRIAIEYAGLMVREERYDLAQEVLQSLPYELRQSEQAAALLAKIEFASTSADMPDRDALLKAIETNPRDSQARYQLSTRYTMEGQYQAALDQLLEILKYDRQFDDDAARKGMLKIFDMLGDNELVTQYRKKMMAALY